MKKIAVIAIELALIGSIAIPVGAQFEPIGSPPISTIDEVKQFLAGIFETLQIIFFIVAGIFIILAAFFYLTAAGSEDKVRKAKQQLMYAVVAIVIALFSTGVRGIIETLLRDTRGAI